ncbi:MAG TPA: heavy metal-binding domain-containing protein [Chitinophagales bacterium]|nr:heavy metal-binding domain-containing protein [Chitinophagales bacterium]
MKKGIMLSITVLALVLGACNNSSNSSAHFHAVDTNKLVKGDAYYQCAMHPDQITDTTDACPVCGDELVKHVKQ